MKHLGHPADLEEGVPQRLGRCGPLCRVPVAQPCNQVQRMRGGLRYLRTTHTFSEYIPATYHCPLQAIACS